MHQRWAMPAAISQDDVARWLVAVLHNPTFADGLPPLERVWLATKGLSILKRSIPKASVSQFLQTVRIGWQYTAGPGSGATMGSTAIAVRVMQSAGLVVPSDVADNVERLLAQAPRYNDETAMVSEVLPTWQLADRLLAPEIRQPFAAALASRLDWLSDRIRQSNMTDGTALGVLNAIRQISDANRLGIEANATSLIGRLEGPAGYLNLFASRPSPDPQVTTSAIELGWNPPSQLVSTLTLSARSTGWLGIPVMPSIRATYFGVGLLHLAGIWSRDGMVARQMASWWPSIVEGQAATLSDLFYAMRLSMIVGVAIPPDAVSTARRLFPARDNGRVDALWLIRLEHLFVDLRVDIVDLPRPDDSDWIAAAAAPSATIADMYARHVILQANGHNDPQLDRQLERLRVGSSYRYSPAVAVADLRSTAMGLTIARPAPAVVARAMTPFESVYGTKMFPVVEGAGNQTTVESLAIGAYLLSGSYDIDLAVDDVKVANPSLMRNESGWGKSVLLA